MHVIGLCLFATTTRQPPHVSVVDLRVVSDKKLHEVESAFAALDLGDCGLVTAWKTDAQVGKRIRCIGRQAARLQ
jgi:hypothetical protein